VCLSVKKHIAQNHDIHAVKFITCAVAYPPKKDVLAYLGIPLQTGEKPESWEKTHQLSRRAIADVSGQFLSVLCGFDIRF
jgi:primary-amine oxidase